MILTLTLFSLVVSRLATAAPFTIHNETVMVTTEFYPDSFIIYTSQYDIVNILAPVTYLNDFYDETEDIVNILKMPFFFIEADVDENDQRTYKGLYIFRDNKETKLLDNGRDFASNDEATTRVFLGAQDGIYVYKEETKDVVKYGSVSDSIIGIAKPIFSDVIYILTEDNELFNVTEAGTKKTKVNEVVGARQIVLDYSNNLFFYAEDKQVYVLTPDGVKKIEGLPMNPTSVYLIKPPFVLAHGVPIVIDNTVYFIYETGLSEAIGLEFKPNAKPTAYSMEATVFQYYGHNKNIYGYNLHNITEHVMSGDFKDLIDENTNNLQLLATKTKEKKASKKTHA